MTKALIIGAGICGPVTAMALQRAGIDTVVYEARSRSGENAGSYLTVATNGLDALRAIDAHAPVLAAGFPTRATALYSGTGRRLGTVPIGAMQPDRRASRTIKRAHLRAVLRRESVRRRAPFWFGNPLI